jgi:hypothetical protein
MYVRFPGYHYILLLCRVYAAVYTDRFLCRSWLIPCLSSKHLGYTLCFCEKTSPLSIFGDNVEIYCRAGLTGLILWALYPFFFVLVGIHVVLHTVSRDPCFVSFLCHSLSLDCLSWSVTMVTVVVVRYGWVHWPVTDSYWQCIKDPRLNFELFCDWLKTDHMLWLLVYDWIIPPPTLVSEGQLLFGEVL